MFLLTEQIMNGTVTMQVVSTGVEAETFKDAIMKVKNELKKGLLNFSKMAILTETDFEFSYSINQQFPCYGRMENKVLSII